MTDLISSFYKMLDAAVPCRRLSAAVSESIGHSRRIGVKGLRGSSFAAVMAWLTERATPSPSIVFVVTGNRDRANEVVDDWEFFTAGGRPLHWAQPEVLPYDEDEQLLEDQIQHLEMLDVLARIRAGEKFDRPPVCVAPVDALFWRVPTSEETDRSRYVVNWGESLDPAAFSKAVMDLGYSPVTTVEVRGEFAVRGGIVDIFPVQADNAMRIDLFGNDIESIRPFDVNNQRSLRNAPEVEQLVILPANESVMFGRALGHNKSLPTLFDLLPDDALVIFDGLEGWALHEENFWNLAERRYREHGEGKPSPEVLFASLTELQKAVNKHTQIHHSLLLESAVGRTIIFNPETFENVKPDFKYYADRVMASVRGGNSVVMVCDNEGQAKRLTELMLNEEVPVELYLPESRTHRVLPSLVMPRNGESEIPRFPVALVLVGSMSSGFRLPECGLFAVTDREIFGRYKRRHVVRRSAAKSGNVIDPREIRSGDFVVHMEYGIGRFEGIRTLEYDGKRVDMIELCYADNEKVLVPIDKVSVIHKYNATGDSLPELDVLGGKRWLNKRRKCEEEIRKYAEELLQLYAKRSVAKGICYDIDSDVQRAFEDSFLYVETYDQLKAIREVKRDMESTRPMDRLVCGDVGFGKTEVAIRAAFKAIQEGRQVALLCPTTILAQQHFTNFRERFADYPIRVDMMSRFRSPKEIRQIKEDLREGRVNMIIGTHGLLSKTVEFKNLGLLVVDEEQRFGVGQKERLREMRVGVDCLTLTATPIPRTLHMSLSGLRDMSIINTPPIDRHPIRTRVVHWDRDMVEEALLREINRGGQVFYVHNRVQNIYDEARKLQEVAPHARIAVAHGQMDELDLENVLLEFIDQKYDILVSTSIIETGVDMPNVNTILINRADMFGLAQLYQLRGRVGRQSRQAYAYLLMPPEERITDQAIARLSAIQDFTNLGSGFNLAMRDLEIRGVGNLLGKAQHGNVTDIGFDLYCKLLEKAVDKLKSEGDAEGTLFDEDKTVEIRWQMNAGIPVNYIPLESQRVTIYKQVAEARELREIDDIAEEIRDRFGEVTLKPGADGQMREDLPGAVKNLLSAGRIRIICQELFIDRVSQANRGFKLHFRRGFETALNTVAKLPRRNGNPTVYADEPQTLEFSYSDWTTRKKLMTCINVLLFLSDKTEK